VLSFLVFVGIFSWNKIILVTAWTGLMVLFSSPPPTTTPLPSPSSQLEGKPLLKSGKTKEWSKRDVRSADTGSILNQHLGLAG
jgi:hypothetical protein